MVERSFFFSRPLLPVIIIIIIIIPYFYTRMSFTYLVIPWKLSVQQRTNRNVKFCRNSLVLPSRRHFTSKRSAILNSFPPMKRRECSAFFFNPLVALYLDFCLSSSASLSSLLMFSSDGHHVYACLLPHLKKRSQTPLPIRRTALLYIHIYIIIPIHLFYPPPNPPPLFEAAPFDVEIFFKRIISNLFKFFCPNTANYNCFWNHRYSIYRAWQQCRKIITVIGVNWMINLKILKLF